MPGLWQPILEVELAKKTVLAADRWSHHRHSPVANNVATKESWFDSTINRVLQQPQPKPDISYR